MQTYTVYVSKRFLSWIHCFTGSQCKLLRAQLVDEKRGSLQTIWQIVFWMPWRWLRSLTDIPRQKWVTVIKSDSNQGIGQCNSSWFTQMKPNSSKITYVVETWYMYRIYLSRKCKTRIKNNKFKKTIPLLFWAKNYELCFIRIEL